MPNFMVLARKTRDMIYVQALVSDKILMKEQEKAEDASDSRINPRYSANDFITNQSNTQQAGPLGLLFSNTFRVSSPYSISGKPSIFNSDAILFRRVLVELFADPSPWEQTRDLGVALVSVWQNQIRALAPMINLQCLKLKVLGLLDVDWGLRRCGVLRYMLLEGVAAHYLKPELLTILPAAIREGTLREIAALGSPGRSHLVSGEMRAFFEAQREPRVYFAWETPSRCW